ncbi:histone-like nucleoid-structuring protein Lsr2 [Pseudonocardia spinosispora]|uniref:histone-like nucleoid-structuring protein Lsr2 n=1 Tax=Pseudonocardia spinosispora TaxID=103441 RepID=UPI00041D36CC|nr:Lsr2 family protein [Pseudonocardia spinosispora]
MAQRVMVSLVDDLDGGRADRTVQFALDGKSYEIDLSDENAAKLGEALARYLAVARRPYSGHGADRGSTTITAVEREQNRAIRDWARRRGMNISARGRIPSGVSMAYHRDR